MLRLFAFAVMVIAAGCPKKGGTGPQVQPGVGCPAASAVYIASLHVPEGAGAKPSWVLPLHDKVVDKLDGVPEYGPIDAAAAQAAGVPAPPQNLWLMLPQKGGAVSCKVVFGGYYQAAVDAPTKNIAYGIELSGCLPQADSGLETAIALASAEPPNQCAVVVPREIAARVGTQDQAGKWSLPTKETPIPPAIAQQIPQRECTAPACEKLWTVGQIDLGPNKPVAWGVAANWLAVGAPDKPCEWKAETFSSVFVADASGAPVKVSEGQDHPLPLFAVLADRGGAKVIVASGPGEYTAYDYANGATTVGRHLVWLVPHPDSYEANLGPDCP